MKNQGKKKSLKFLIGKLISYSLIVILCFYIASEVFFPSQTIKIYGFKPYVVLTDSMVPVIQPNDFVLIKNINPKDVHVGDIITFRVDVNQDGKKEVVTHFIYSISETSNGVLTYQTNRYYTNASDKLPDPWLISSSDIVGQYVLTVPYIGQGIMFIKSPFGIMAVLVNVTLISLIVVLIKQEKKPNK